MQKKKILFVIHQLNYGGVQKALLSALNAIDYSQNEVVLYVRKNRVDLLGDINLNVNKVIVNEDRTHYYRKPYAMWLTLSEKICRAIGKNDKAELVHQKLVSYLNEAKMQYEKEHYFRDEEEYDVAISYIQGYTAQFVAEYIRAKKKIMFYHGSTDETHELHDKIMEHVDKIVGVNEGVQNVLKGLYPKFADKMTYIENYVDAEEVRRRSQEYQIERKDVDFVLCSCGRLTPVKGFDLAIEAARILKENNTSFLWYFVGDGPEREKLERRIAENALTDYIEITGMLDNPYPYIANCDIYVQSSYEEAHPLAIIEALILNIPVVTTNTVGGNALIEENTNGKIVKSNEVELSHGIESLLSAPEIILEMSTYLQSVDYSKAWKIYNQKWEKLLEVR